MGRRRSILLALVAAALVAVVAVAIAGREDEPAGTGPTLAEARARLAGAPGPLADLHAEANRLLQGGTAAFAARLRALRGYPVVVNKWASWCGPCRFEFPVFQRQAVAFGRRVAFLGVDGFDNAEDAAAFLRDHPVSYPSYADPDEKIVRAIGAPANYPITVFYDRRGRRTFMHQGPYRTDADLAADIRRHALGAS